MKPAITLLLVPFAISVLSGCASRTVNGGPIFGNRDDTSETTEISIGLPDRSGLKDKVQDIETKMNAFRLVVKATDPAACTDPTAIDATSDYGTNAKLGAVLKQGCDYDLTLELGQKTPPTNPDLQPAPVSYIQDVKPLLDRTCVKCHTPTADEGNLTDYASAKARGAEVIRRATVLQNMPSAQPLLPAEQEVLKKWAKGGYLEKAPDVTPPGTTEPKLVAIYFTNATALRITKDEIQGKTEYKAKIVVDVTAAGRAIGLGD